MEEGYRTTDIKDSLICTDGRNKIANFEWKENTKGLVIMLL